MLQKFYPDRYLRSAYEIDYGRYYEEGYRGIIFDIDNTLVPHGAPADERSIALIENLKGLGFGIMAGFIPSQAPNAEAAYAFLDYINQPENAAKCFEFLGYYCTNKAAEEHISGEMRDLLVLPEDAAAGEIVQNISQEAEDLHAEIWNQFRSACG